MMFLFVFCNALKKTSLSLSLWLSLSLSLSLSVPLSLSQVGAECESYGGEGSHGIHEVPRTLMNKEFACPFAHFVYLAHPRV
jgi:hypothetical protein